MRSTILLAAILATGSAASAAPVFNPANGHYYERLSDASITGFDAAVTFAAAQTFNGLQGYLATITSAEENRFVFDNVTDGVGGTPGYGGGSDAQTEGTWRWVTGPEAGQAFFVEGAAVQPGYSNWNAGEPNGGTGSNSLNLFNNSPAGWNDIPSVPNAVFVEYGGLDAVGSVPEPASWAMMIGGLAAVGAQLRRRTVRRTGFAAA